MDIEMPSGHPAAAAVQPVWPQVESSQREHNAEVARGAVRWAQQGIDQLDRAQNLHRDGWKGKSGEAAQQENTAIKHAAQKFQGWQDDCARKFQESAGLTRAFKNALHSLFERAKSDYDAIPNSPIAEGLRERVIALATAEARETQAFYVEQALALKMPPPPPEIAQLGGGTSQPHNGSSSDGRNEAKPMDFSKSPKESDTKGAGGDDKETKNKGDEKVEKKNHNPKAGGEDVTKEKGDQNEHLKDADHITNAKASGDNVGTLNPGAQSPTGAGASQLGSAMSGMTSPASGMGGGAGSPTSALQGLQSLGKGINPGQGIHALGQTGSGATRPMSSSPLTSLSEGFGSGMSSGLSSASSGAGSVGPATPAGAVQQPSQFVAPVARPEAAVPPAATSGPVNAAGVNTGAPPPPPSGAGGAIGGGGGMMAPYSSPTSGVGSGGGGAAPPGAASGGGTPPPASGSSSTTMAPMPPPEERAAPVRAGRNPDLVLAEKLVGDLVRGAPMALAEWAVSVVRTSAGPQVYVASSVAGGSFIPQGVHLPTSARLAIADTVLTPGWWAPYIGWTRPVDILVEHFSKLTEVVSGASLSAVATTSMASRLPAHLRADFSLVDRNSVGSGAAPALGGGHQHRLATIDPAMYARIRALRPEVAMVAAVGTTNTVLQEAQNVQGVSGALSTDAETAMLQKVAQRGATEQDWVSYKTAARSAETELTTRATHSYDDEPETQREREAYQLAFRRARIVELVCCWEEPLTPSLPDIVYNAICAGYQPAQIIDQAEQQHLAGR
ncbi:putative methyl-accepting chemotaxis sensory transducer [Mycobacteroides abscessus subsp. abscessus]|uniref:hypothetical protein n=3 Tax=Mycobacteroides abscessus TaxID=36809 RepID=UPI0009268401|nr:hypothetical protein [Mycobacteroides abscessus]SHS17668.1 putative methyl-accepting chemotaxis sensory transducer [Mycobacteroides abscessus subsp. abscessus]